MSNKRERCIQGLKDRAVLFAWVAGLLLLISLIWIFTQPLQSNYLLRAVNSVFINNNDDRRLAAVISYNSDEGIKQSLTLFGYWYSMHNSTDKMFIFTVFQDGILVPLGAIVSADGIVSEILPLSTHAAQVFESLPDSILRVYVSRIESSLIQTGIEGKK